MIPRDETEAVNWKPHSLPKPPLPAIDTPKETEAGQQPQEVEGERELFSRSEFITETFVSKEGVAFFFPRNEANAFNLGAEDIGSKTNVANFEEDERDNAGANGGVTAHKVRRKHQ